MDCMEPNPDEKVSVSDVLSYFEQMQWPWKKMRDRDREPDKL